MVVARRRKYASRYRRRGSYARRWRRWGVTKSWTNGTRNFKVIARTTYTITFTIPANAQTSDVYVVTPYTNTTGPWVGLAGSSNYQRWTTLFDEVKCDWMTVAVNPVVVNPADTAGRAINFLLDRKFNRSEQGFQSLNVLNAANVITKRFNTNTAGTARVFAGASNLEERTKYHDCSLETNRDAEWYAGRDVGFCPGWYLSASVDTPAAAAQQVSFVVETKAQFTFRNVKYE